MLDLSRLTETLAGLFGGNSIVESVTQSSGVQDLLQNAGIDPASLAGLTPDGIQQLLADHGIDPTALMDGQLHQLLGNFGLDGQSIETMSALWSDGSANGSD